MRVQIGFAARLTGLPFTSTPTLDQPPEPLPNIFRVPRERGLLLTHEVSKPAPFMKKLQSEEGRHIYAETFAENLRLATLSDLAVEALAKNPNIPYLPSDPLKIRVYYDKLDVELPLEECWPVENERYWRRVVLTKNEDKMQWLDDEREWRGEGISRKYVEMVERCPAEYWPDEEMQALALKINGFVKEMHIRRLQSLQDRALEEYLEVFLHPDNEIPVSPSESMMNEAQSNAATAAVAGKKKKGAEAEPAPPPKPKKKVIKSLFELELEDDEKEVPGLLIPDKRSLVEYTEKKKQDKCPMEICHHIDLSFIRHFNQLTVFTIEFLGPLQNTSYNVKHFRFSYEDIKRLATGLQSLLQLQVFRLCNSYMDAEKLETVLTELVNLKNLQEMEFSNDHLGDDCGDVFKAFFGHSSSVSTLILEGNFFAVQTMKGLAHGIAHYEGNLNYLSVKNNPLDDEAALELVNGIVGTEQVRTLVLSGVRLTPNGVSTCIAHELLQHHPILESLEFRSMTLHKSSVVEIIKALELNKTLQHFDCRGCDMDFDDERDIKILIRRNQYIRQNPYLEDKTQTEQQINDYVSRIKNPVLLKVLESLHNHCTPDTAIPEYVWTEDDDDTSKTSVELDDDADDVDDGHSQRAEDRPPKPTPIVFELNSVEDILKHIAIPGPSERFHYFKNLKKQYQ